MEPRLPFWQTATGWAAIAPGQSTAQDFATEDQAWVWARLGESLDPAQATTRRREVTLSLRDHPATAWEQELKDILAAGRDVLRRAAALGEYSHDNDLDLLIGGAADGSIVPGTGMTKEEALPRLLLLQQLNEFMSQQATGAPEGVTRRKILNQKI